MMDACQIMHDFTRFPIIDRHVSILPIHGNVVLTGLFSSGTDLATTDMGDCNSCDVRIDDSDDLLSIDIFRGDEDRGEA